MVVAIVRERLLYEWDFVATLADMDLLLLGLWNTIQVFFLALVFGVPLGLGLALGRMSRILVLSQLCSFIIEFSAQRRHWSSSSGFFSHYRF